MYNFYNISFMEAMKMLEDEKEDDLFFIGTDGNLYNVNNYKSDFDDLKNKSYFRRAISEERKWISNARLKENE